MWQDNGKAPSSETINSAINVLESKALFEGKQHRLYNRVAPDPDGDGIWIDMCNDNWQAIHVTKEGWKIDDNPPILFRRYSHQQPLANPRHGGDPKLFLKFVNLTGNNGDNAVLLLVEIIHFLIPEIPPRTANSLWSARLREVNLVQTRQANDRPLFCRVA